MFAPPGATARPAAKAVDDDADLTNDVAAQRRQRQRDREACAALLARGHGYAVAAVVLD